MNTAKRFLLLPPEQAYVTSEVSRRALTETSSNSSEPINRVCVGEQEHSVKVIDIAESGTSLIEMDADVGSDLARRQPIGGYRIFENKIYQPMAISVGNVRPTMPVAQGSMLEAAAEVIHVPFALTDLATGKPVPGATVMLFADKTAGKGSTGITDANGRCSVPWLRNMATIQQLWVMPPNPPTFWGHYAASVELRDEFALNVTPVDPAYLDSARYYWARTGFDTGLGITVGIVDTGVAAEPSLNVVGGANTVAGENPTEFGCNGDPHGTHVAGLVGAHGPMTGNAPGVALRSYRVFGSGGAGATSFAIIKGIEAAVADGCDVINLSLGVEGDDPPLHVAIRHARDRGVLVVAAGNNNYGGPVGSPACYAETIGVSAVGRLSCIPVGAQPMAHVTATRGSDEDCFFADFSCVGSELKLSAPGVGVISTVPGGYGQMSGTSMASPLLAGQAARLLASTPHILHAARDRARSDALEAALLDAAETLGLVANQQGRGLPNRNVNPVRPERR